MVSSHTAHQDVVHFPFADCIWHWQIWNDLMKFLDFEETDLEKTIDVIGKRKDKVKSRWNCAIVKTSIFFSTERQPLCDPDILCSIPR
jgi:hypothetical protein